MEPLQDEAVAGSVLIRMVWDEKLMISRALPLDETMNVLSGLNGVLPKKVVDGGRRFIVSNADFLVGDIGRAAASRTTTDSKFAQFTHNI